MIRALLTFWYNPVTKRAHTFFDTCFGNMCFFYKLQTLISYPICIDLIVKNIYRHKMANNRENQILLN